MQFLKLALSILLVAPALAEAKDMIELKAKLAYNPEIRGAGSAELQIQFTLKNSGTEALGLNLYDYDWWVEDLETSPAWSIERIAIPLVRMAPPEKKHLLHLKRGETHSLSIPHWTKGMILWTAPRTEQKEGLRAGARLVQPGILRAKFCFRSQGLTNISGYFRKKLKPRAYTWWSGTACTATRIEIEIPNL